MDKCEEILKWLDVNQMAEKEEFEHQQKELESISNPIMTKLYAGAEGGMPGGGSGVAKMLRLRRIIRRMKSWVTLLWQRMRRIEPTIEKAD